MPWVFTLALNSTIMENQDYLDIKGRVINIQRYCGEDGPGTRTTVFVKGCSLRCKWCSNPESIKPKPELDFNKKVCKGAAECGICLKEPFPQGAFYVPDGEDDLVVPNWDLANSCTEELASLCPTGAIGMFGKLMTAREVLDEVLKDESMYRNTGGGVTISGGECLLQPDFTAAILRGAQESGIHTAIETAGNVPWEFMEKVLQYVNLMLHDNKLMNPERHKKWTGVDNKRILENFQKAYQTFPHVEFITRTPLIPGINANEEHIRAALEFIKPYKNVIDYELLPYHRFGLGKYEFLGKVYELKDFTSPTPEMLKQFRAMIDDAFGRTTV